MKTVLTTVHTDELSRLPRHRRFSRRDAAAARIYPQTASVEGTVVVGMLLYSIPQSFTLVVGSSGLECELKGCRKLAISMRDGELDHGTNQVKWGNTLFINK